MKTAGRSIGIVLMILVMISAQAFAQNGGDSGSGSQVMAQNTETRGGGGVNNGGYGTDEGGFGEGECQNTRVRTRSKIQMQILMNAEPVTISGVVSEAPYDGSGLLVVVGEGDTDDTTVYGIGPQWYWDLLGVSKPDVLEEVEIEALKIILNDGSEKIIAITITILGDGADIADIIVPLRDEDGRPLWRRGGYGLDS